ncbi:MAG TPA: dolichyl-phosphate beta-glucosyltransferase [Candidatus Sulfotelmatobacter sp.]|nr:dolichyl-phosphate beta-glucosyltransferase [Candidatus Sulfotelmatobacter sp.]
MLSIIIPARNEATRLPRTLEHILAYLQTKRWSAEIIVINDGSTDDTAQVVRGYMAKNSSIILIDNPVNTGKGSSIRDGMLRANGDIILFTDADDSTPIEEAEKLINEIHAGADIVIGSRWVDRNLQAEPQPWYRRLNGRIYNLLLRSILGLELTDTQNGFKAFTRTAGKAAFAIQKIPGWGFDAESLFFANKLGFTVREVPVSYLYYAEGSKIRPYRDGARMLLELLLVRWHQMSGAYARAGTRSTSERSTFAAQSFTQSQSSE